MEDLKLIDSFINGDKNSFEELMIKYQESAIAFAKRYVTDEYIAEDIAQEAFAYIYVHRAKYKRKYSFKTYLFTIIKNKSIDYIRKNKPINFVDNIEPAYYLSSSTKENHLSAENEVIKREEIETIQGCLDNLKEDYRTVIYLYEYEELSYKEIAKVMNKNMAQIKILMYRARKKLGEIYFDREVMDNGGR
ncbi:RNA polymerase sigma factor [Oceanirhabdus sp. W0125-5]|uniref:RNA polymerase sigma factor n=1 Tax=Oceanirhabdus sp. W0125-5 TaxID=2999116 RepID=UPI0022F2F9BD|nr:RNA polymerase sigma factor [Oceanirhabdus sp. W0125-5]WBW98898.1 RNA polymerase sigma factor [Oceanirhabdus sp. W0125-5]